MTRSAAGAASVPGGTPGLEYKAAPAAAGTGSVEAGVIDTHDETGVVEAIVSVTGVVDNDRDVIEPGAYAKTLQRRRPKGIFSHDWSQWASRTEEVEELMPGDARLAEYAAKAGKQWPPEAGALYVKTRYNLATPEGRSAYENVKFFDKETEWSIGYKVPSGKAVRGRDGVRRIKEVDLYEYSPVLFGAASLSGTLSVKRAGAAPADGGADDAQVDDPTGDTTDDTTDGTTEDTTDGPADGGPGLGEDPDGDPDCDGGHGDDGGPDDDRDDIADLTEWVEAYTEASEFADHLAGDSPDDGPDGDGPDEDPDVGAQDDEDGPAPDTKAVPGGGSKPAPKSGSGTRATTPGGDGDTWKIRNVDELRAAVRGFGAVKPSEKEKVRAHIMKRAFALNRPDLIPAGWKDKKGTKSGRPWGAEFTTLTEVYEALESERAVDPDETKMRHESLNRSPRKNWVEMAGQLPAYIQHIANDLNQERGMPLSRAIPTAIAAVKRWARGGGNVKPETRAKAAKAVAEWEKLKAASRARSGKKDFMDSPAHDGDVHGLVHDGWDGDVEVKGYLPGTFEELHDNLREAAAGLLSIPSPYIVEILGTWPDRAVVARYPLAGEEKAEAFEVGYGIDESGEVELGALTPVTITAEYAGERARGVDMTPFPAMVDDVAGAVKTMLAADGLDAKTMESKAGRVLSGVNATRLKNAVENLVAVLKAAGIELSVPDEPDDEQDPPNERDSTAPSLDTRPVPEGKVLVDPGLHARAYRILADVHSGA